jgi:hypothetical protein
MIYNISDSAKIHQILSQYGTVSISAAQSTESIIYTVYPLPKHKLTVSLNQDELRVEIVDEVLFNNPLKRLQALHSAVATSIDGELRVSY